jgi:hypothetical protein
LVSWYWSNRIRYHIFHTNSTLILRKDLVFTGAVFQVWRITVLPMLLTTCSRVLRWGPAWRLGLDQYIALTMFLLSAKRTFEAFDSAGRFWLNR